MKQMIKETAPEVKREIYALTTKWDRPVWLREKSEEACYELLSKAGRIEHFPAFFVTNTEEVARFFGIENAQWKVFREQITNLTRNYGLFDEFPSVHYQEFVKEMKERAAVMMIPCNESVDAEGYHYFSSDSNPQHMVKLGKANRAIRNGIRVVTMRGIIWLAFYMEKNPRFATPVTRNIVRLCRETGFDRISEPKPEPTHEPVQQEPAPESPKMDYAETLRKLFDSVLTLVEKQAEERGAEKIVQKLKDAGKL